MLESRNGARQVMQTTIAGKTLAYDLTVEPMQASAGAVVGITCALRDDTEPRGRARTYATANAYLASDKQW